MTTTNPDSTSCCTPAADSTAASCCSTAIDAKAASMDELREEIPADVAALRSAGFNLLLDTGRAAKAGDLIATTGLPAERATEILAEVRGQGRVEFDDQGRLVGIAGLTVTPGPHELTIDGATRWTWCALDAVGILSALGATGSVRSTDPQTGDHIEIEFIDGRPDTNVHIFILGGFSEGNVREDWCPRVNFFTTRSAAEKWVASKELDGDVVAVTDIVEDAAAMWRPVVDVDAPQVG